MRREAEAAVNASNAGSPRGSFGSFGSPGAAGGGTQYNTPERGQPPPPPTVVPLSHVTTPSGKPPPPPGLPAVMPAVFADDGSDGTDSEIAAVVPQSPPRGSEKAAELEAAALKVCARSIYHGAHRYISTCRYISMYASPTVTHRHLPPPTVTYRYLPLPTVI